MLDYYHVGVCIQTFCQVSILYVALEPFQQIIIITTAIVIYYYF